MSDLDVHEHDVKLVAALAHHVQRLLPVAHQLHLGPGLHQEVLGHLLVHCIVFSHQNPDPRQHLRPCPRPAPAPPTRTSTRCASSRSSRTRSSARSCAGRGACS